MELTQRVTAKMDDFSFEVGQILRKGVTVVRIVEAYAQDFVLEHCVSLERRHLTRSELIRGFLEGEVIPCNDEAVQRAMSGDPFVEDDDGPVISGVLPLLSRAAQEDGLRAIRYIQRLEKFGYTSLRPTPLLELDYKKVVKQFGDTNPPKLSTLYTRWLKVQAAGGDWRAAFPHFSGRGGAGKSRIPHETNEALVDVCRRLQSDPKARIRFSQIHHNLHGHLVGKYGQERALELLPSRATIARFTKQQFGAYDISRRNRGKKFADQRFRDWHPRDRAVAPLEVVEFDDKDTRVFAIDERSGLPAGRIYLTAGVDQYSEVPLGFSISDQPRSKWSAINAFVNCVLPNDLTRQEWSEVSGDVPFCGKMGIAVFDNALYNHATALELAAFEVANCGIAYAKPFTPTEKSAVENFNRFLVQGFLPELPGYGGSKGSTDRLSEAVETAVLTVQEFNRRLLKWTYDVHCNIPRESGFTPRQRWEAGMTNRRPYLPADINKVRMAAMHRGEVSLRPEQIQFLGLIYQHPRLLVLRRKLGHNAKVELRFHPYDLAAIHVFDPLDRQWFMAPSTNPEYTTNLTLYQHKLIRKMARMHGARNPSIPALLEEMSKLVKLVEQTRFSKKLRDRKWARRVAGGSEVVDVEVQSTSAREPSTAVVSDLEYLVGEIDSVEMEELDENWALPEW